MQTDKLTCQPRIPNLTYTTLTSRIESQLIDCHYLISYSLSMSVTRLFSEIVGQ